MDGIAKSAEPQGTQEVAKPKSVETGIPLKEQPVDPEVYSYLGADPMTINRDHLGVVYEWAADTAKNRGEVLQNIRKLETKLGQPSGQETRLGKLYNYIRLSNAMKHKVSEMKETLEGAQHGYKSKLKELKTTRDNQLSKINEEVMRVNESYKKAKGLYDRNGSDRIRRLRNEYAQQMEELKAMRDAYKGGR